MNIQITGYIANDNTQYIETTSMLNGLTVRTLTRFTRWYLVAFNHNKKHPCPDFIEWAKRQDAVHRCRLDAERRGKL